MKVAVLTRPQQNIGLIHNILKNENCNCNYLTNLCMLEKEGRNRVLDFLLVDTGFLTNNQDTQILSESLGILNMNIPIFFFDIDVFSPYLVSNKNSANSNDIENILKVLQICQEKFLTFEKSNNRQLRPIEKKLYDLLKKANGKSTSLEEMAFHLWGKCNDSHIKTLYAYIHRIKQILKDGNQNMEWLIKEKKGCYKISYSING